MSLLDQGVEEIKRGFSVENNGYKCHFCEAYFPLEEVFLEEDKYYPAQTMIKRHLSNKHPNKSIELIYFDSKYNTLTDRQKELLEAFSQNKKDSQIAEDLGLSASTIRHQRFTFREKAKQAKLYLATYEAIFDQDNKNVISVPDKAVNVDERFDITEEEYHETVLKYFDFSTGTTKLVRWPKKQKQIISILHRVVEEIEYGNNYTEKELNGILKLVYFDFILLRRYLIEYGFISRKADGSSYWKE